MKKAPDAFRTISEVSEWLETPAHVLRFWESKFSQIKPVKRAGGRRYYRPDDMRLLGGIKQLLHIDGLTIKGAQKILREKGVKHVASLSHDVTEQLSGKGGKQKSDLDALTEEISKNVAEVASAPAAPLVLDQTNITPATAKAEPQEPAQETEPLFPLDVGDTEQPVVFTAEAVAPDPQSDKAEDMDSTEPTANTGAKPARDTDPVLDGVSSSPKTEEISALYGRLKSLRRRMRDPE